METAWRAAVRHMLSTIIASSLLNRSATQVRAEARDRRDACISTAFSY
jgi:hypothetical protein